MVRSLQKRPTGKWHDGRQLVRVLDRIELDDEWVSIDKTVCWRWKGQVNRGNTPVIAFQHGDVDYPRYGTAVRYLMLNLLDDPPPKGSFFPQCMTGQLCVAPHHRKCRVAESPSLALVDLGLLRVAELWRVEALAKVDWPLPSGEPGRIVRQLNDANFVERFAARIAGRTQ